jgi:OmpA-OmpF porin, OOP family
MLMIMRSYKWLSGVAALLLLIGLTIQNANAETRSVDLKAKLLSGQYVPKVDNFIVIMDASASMTDAYKGIIKVDLARNFVSRMNQTIPEMKIAGALRKFGFVKLFSDDKTVLLYGLTAYSKKEFEESVQKVTWGSGDSPMSIGINAAADDLKTAKGKIAVIIVSDWDELGFAPATAAESMKRQYGERLCIYPVMVGYDAQGVKLMEKVAQAGQCGFVSDAAKLTTVEAMDDFVEKVFFMKATSAPLDSDGDGVPDYLDKCPDTPKGVTVDKDGCPLDSDGDGVPDYLDKCPGTPKGVKVDKDGCPFPEAPPEKVSMTLKIEFDTAKSDIKEKYHNEIKQVADFMNRYPQTKTVIEGHTDNVGSVTSNVKLSQSRANSVRAYLIEKFGIDKDRIQAIGYGPKKPVASNATAEGKQKNRRVEAVIETVVKK